MPTIGNRKRNSTSPQNALLSLSSGTSIRQWLERIGSGFPGEQSGQGSEETPVLQRQCVFCCAILKLVLLDVLIVRS